MLLNFELFHQMLFELVPGDPFERIRSKHEFDQINDLVWSFFTRSIIYCYA